jgi:hypothetical protein
MNTTPRYRLRHNEGDAEEVVLDEGVLPALLGEVVTMALNGRSVSYVVLGKHRSTEEHFTVESFAKWIERHGFGPSPEEIEESLAIMLRDGVIERYTDPDTGEAMYRAAQETA